jgi:oligopeptide/dipeptide ABC transporter ATP-binding protein
VVSLLLGRRREPRHWLIEAHGDPAGLAARLQASLAELQALRGREIACVFQDPMSSLNPVFTVGAQLAEPLIKHMGMSKAQAWKRAEELLAEVGIPEPARRMASYPHEMSGGQQQRVMIAMALTCEPKLLIADEPTTALDVTIQAQILDLLRELQKETGMAIILITHDLGVVARMADEVAVMYAGQVVESGSVDDVFYRSAHPYTLGLKQAMPSNHRDVTQRLLPIEGSPPDLFAPPAGCAYAARCPHAMQVCQARAPEIFAAGQGHASRCWLQHPLAPRNASALHVGGVRG